MICRRVTDGETDAEEGSGACPGSAVQLVEGSGPCTADFLSGAPASGSTQPPRGWGREMDPKGEVPGTLVRPQLEALLLRQEGLAKALIHSCPGRQTYCILGHSEDALLS